MGTFGPMHWLIVFAVILLLFGNRMPSIMRSLGQGIVEFKKGLSDIKDETTKALDDKPAEVKKEA
jgi:sec-independent protein translocase protein TatA